MTDFGALLKTYIYLVSSSLLYPVLFLLALLTLVILVYAGSFFAEWLERVRMTKCPAEDLPSLIRTGQAESYISHRVSGYLDALERTIEREGCCETTIANMIQQTSLDIWKSVDRLKILVRTAPALGLIGTLIPMGTGLAALGQGDMSRLSADLVIAFTTTVTGLAVGCAAFFFYTVKQRWLEEDMKNVELVTDILTTAKPEK